MKVKLALIAPLIVIFISFIFVQIVRVHADELTDQPITGPITSPEVSPTPGASVSPGPSASVSPSPSASVSPSPSIIPSGSPSASPSPSVVPSLSPSSSPSPSPSVAPSVSPSPSPSPSPEEEFTVEGRVVETGFFHRRGNRSADDVRIQAVNLFTGETFNTRTGDDGRYSFSLKKGFYFIIPGRNRGFVSPPFAFVNVSSDEKHVNFSIRKMDSLFGWR